MSILIYLWKCLLFSLSIDVRMVYTENGSCTSTTNPTKLIKTKKKKKKMKMKRNDTNSEASFHLSLFFRCSWAKKKNKMRNHLIVPLKYPREKVCCVIFGHLAKTTKKKCMYVCMDVYVNARGSCSRIFYMCQFPCRFFPLTCRNFCREIIRIGTIHTQRVLISSAAKWGWFFASCKVF